MIFCFSGTGNSRYIANCLSKLLNDNVVDAVKRIKNLDNSELNVNGNLILVCPTYAWRIAKVFYDHIKNSKFLNVKGVYFVMSCGGEIGNAGKYNKQLANELGFPYKGTVGIVMPDNYIIMFKSVKDEKAKYLIERAQSKIDSVAKIIEKDEDLPKTKTKLIDVILSSLVNKQFYMFYIKPHGFVVDDDKCTGCGACEISCPLNNIKMVDHRPTFSNNCTHCMRCISYCPANAINYRNKTKGKRPYRIEDYLNK